MTTVVPCVVTGILTDTIDPVRFCYGIDLSLGVEFSSDEVGGKTSSGVEFYCLWLLLYIHDNEKPNRVWFDDIVLATKRVGPVRAGAKRDRP